MPLLVQKYRWVVASLLTIAVIVTVVGLIGSFRAASEKRFQATLSEARESLEKGRHATARAKLADLLALRPADGQALYLMGLCEQLRGRDDLALAAWEAVPPDSPDAGPAALSRARVEQGRGRLAETERLLGEALDRPGPHRPIARWDLVRLLRLEGRSDEAIRRFRQGLAEHPEPAEGLRMLLKLETDVYPVEMARAQFEQALRVAPDDDRVWLGLANVAIHSGKLDEARGWLDRCLKARPDDPAVWLARLEWARASGFTAEVEAALPHLPAPDDPDTLAFALSLRAWLAAQAGQADAEAEALAELDRVEPGRPEVLDALARLALARGRPGDAEALRLRRVAREEARKAYIRAMSAPEPLGRAAELADLAASAGRAFEAAAWRALSQSDPKSAPALLEPIARRFVPPTSPPRTLAALVAPPASRRPATAEGPGPALLPRFEDAAPASGLASFVHETGHVDNRLALPETMAGGVALLDFDGDGWLDVYAVQGGPFPPPPGSKSADRLFRNRGDGTFEDASQPAGLADLAGGYGHGVAAGDYDNDGHPDLLVTRWRSYQLLRNRGDGTFEDATRSAGLSGDRDWPTSAAFADLDADGDLDLYVCHYLAWDEVDDRTCIDPKNPAVYNCNPLSFKARPDHIFRNDSGSFVDITRAAGAFEEKGRGLGVLAADVDGDRKIDLFVSNDMSANFLWAPASPGTFEDRAVPAGVAGNATGGYQAGMGVACGDLDGDGLLDLLVANYYGESTTFFKNLGGGFFADESEAINLKAPTRDRLGFGLALLDANNDGLLDLLSANGHVHDGRPDYPYAMRPQLLVGTPSGRLRDATDDAGPPFARQLLGRGLAAGDLDNDGRVDAVLVSQGEPLLYLRNTTESPGHFASFRLVGTDSGRDAVGATVEVHASGRPRVACRVGGGSYQSAPDPRLHFGLGASATIDHVEVRWPSGRTDRFHDLPADRFYTLREGDSSPASSAPPGGPDH